MATALIVLLIAGYAYLGVRNFQLWKQNKNLGSDVNFWRDMALKGNAGLPDPKSAEFLRPDKK